MNALDVTRIVYVLVALSALRQIKVLAQLASDGRPTLPAR